MLEWEEVIKFYGGETSFNLDISQLKVHKEWGSRTLKPFKRSMTWYIKIMIGKSRTLSIFNLSHLSLQSILKKKGYG